MSDKSSVVKLAVYAGTAIFIGYIVKKLRNPIKKDKDLERDGTLEKYLTEHKSDYKNVLKDIISKNDLKALKQFKHFKWDKFEEIIKAHGDELLTVLANCNTDIRKFIGKQLFEKIRIGGKIFTWLSYFGFPYDAGQTVWPKFISPSDISINKTLNVEDIDIVNKLFNKVISIGDEPGYFPWCNVCKKDMGACTCLRAHFIAGLTPADIEIERKSQERESNDVNWKWRDFEIILSIWTVMRGRRASPGACCNVCGASGLCWCIRTRFIDGISYERVQFVKTLGEDWRNDYKDDLENYWTMRKPSPSVKYCETCGERKYGCRCDKEQFMKSFSAGELYDYLCMKRFKVIIDRGKPKP